MHALRYTGFFPGKRDTMGKTPVLAQDAALNPSKGDFLYAQTKNFVARRDDPCLSETWKSKPCPNLWPQAQEADLEQQGPKEHVATKSNIMFGDPRLDYSTDSMRTSYQAFFDKMVLPQQPKGPKTMSGEELRSMSVQDTIAAYEDAKKRLGEARIKVIMDTLKMRLSAKVSKGSNNAFMLRRLFKSIDQEDSGFIDLDNFRIMLESFGMQLDQDQALALIGTHDTNGEGLLDYDILMKRLLDPDYYALFAGKRGVRRTEKSATQTAAEDYNQRLKNIQEKIGDKVASRKEKMLDVFRIFDEDKNGRVSRSELGNGLSAFNIYLTEAELDFLFLAADENADGIDYNEFVSTFSG